MNEKIETASGSGSLLIWGIMFTLLVIGAGYLAWINKDIER